MGLANCTQKPIVSKQTLRTPQNDASIMQNMILNKNANFYGDQAIGSAITVIKVSKTIFLL